MKDHPYFIIQREIGKSSWFGFSILLKENCGFSRKKLIRFLKDNLIEYRPIVTGSFSKQPVIRYLNADLGEDLSNADSVDKNGLFVGNHHIDIRTNLDVLNDFKV